MGPNKFEAMVVSMETNLATIKGEVYNFVNGKKKSGGTIRKCLLNMSKISKDFRQEIQEVKKGLPVRRRNISPETREKMATRRREAAAKRKEAKEAKSNKATKATKVTVVKK